MEPRAVAGWDAVATLAHHTITPRPGRVSTLPSWPHDAARLTRVALGVGLGAAAAIVWEVLEYITFIPGSPEAATAYQDTLDDLALGLLGSLIGASVAAVSLLDAKSDRTYHR
jgi:hypothetical protein